jgi:hypothetical protein
LIGNEFPTTPLVAHAQRKKEAPQIGAQTQSRSSLPSNGVIEGLTLRSGAAIILIVGIDAGVREERWTSRNVARDVSLMHIAHSRDDVQPRGMALEVGVLPTKV